jgi:membrane protease YdiL (CAAX protease family)
LDRNSSPTEGAVVARPSRAALFLIGLVVILVCVYSQYVIPGLNLISGLLLAYPIPILVTGLIWGRTIIKKAFNQTLTAVKFCLGYFGAFMVLGVVVGIFIVSLLSVFNPAAVNLLQKPNPVLQGLSSIDAWLMVGISLFVVGPAEEYLFRGFVFGGLLTVFKNRHWLSLALVSSILFAAVHLYYATTYEVASLVPFAGLIAFGMAMAATYHVSGGNLIVPALIHGAWDAIAFVGVATSTTISDQLEGLMILIGIIVAIAIFAQQKMNKNPNSHSSMRAL